MSFLKIKYNNLLERLLYLKINYRMIHIFNYIWTLNNMCLTKVNHF